MNSQYPLARKEQLVVRELADEVLIYDLQRHKALCLNKVAGAVWKQSDGQTSARQIADDLSLRFSATIAEEMVWHAIDQLGRDHLLEYCIPAASRGVTRRQQLRSLGKAAAIAGPVVAGISVARADPKSCGNPGKRCSSDADCCGALVCKSGTCTPPGRAK